MEDVHKGYKKRMIGWITFDAGLILVVLSIACSSIPATLLACLFIGLGFACLMKGIDEEFK